MSICIKDGYFKSVFFLLAGLVSQATFADQSTRASSPTIVFQLGGYTASQGNAQKIGIDGLIGDYFTVNQQRDANILLGAGYYLDGLKKDTFKLLYGINAFYFAHTAVQGNVIQEQLFTNLSYHYYLTNYPVYAATKIFIKTRNSKYDIALDFGVGPNFISVTDFTERSLDGGVTIPDNIFSSQLSAALSATAGVGIKFNKLIGVPCELSYRFFYLGQGSLKKSNAQVLDTLKTGYSYANTLIFSAYI